MGRVGALLLRRCSQQAARPVSKLCRPQMFGLKIEERLGAKGYAVIKDPFKHDDL